MLRIRRCDLDSFIIWERLQKEYQRYKIACWWLSAGGIDRRAYAEIINSSISFSNSWTGTPAGVDDPFVTILCKPNISRDVYLCSTMDDILEEYSAYNKKL